MEWDVRGIGMKNDAMTHNIDDIENEHDDMKIVALCIMFYFKVSNVSKNTALEVYSFV